ncbi:MAG: hypothetical protein FJX46_17625 [Alphaproteobacteria bacterium]|nr:hypothetical protein [Alphaproteobacteria bacterium]
MDQDEETADAHQPGDFPELQAIARFVAGLEAVAWFGAVGEKLTADEAAAARAYLDALGFPDAGIGQVIDWDEAGDAAQNPELNSDWWEAEEQARMALIAEAEARLTGPELLSALDHVAQEAARIAGAAAVDSAARFGCEDEALVRAAAGAAAQACHQAALVLAAGAEPDHPFALKFRLYESGRWPLGVAGGTFNLF